MDRNGVRAVTMRAVLVRNQDRTALVMTLYETSFLHESCRFVGRENLATVQQPPSMELGTSAKLVYIV